MADLSSVFASYLATNRGPNGQPSLYGVTATLDDDLIQLTLTFKNECEYCCMEAGCHITLSPEKRWDGLRFVLARHDVESPDRFRLRMIVVVESGARFFNFTKPVPGKRNTYEFIAVRGSTHTNEIAEKESGV